MIQIHYHHLLYLLPMVNFLKKNVVKMVKHYVNLIQIHTILKTDNVILNYNHLQMLATLTMTNQNIQTITNNISNNEKIENEIYEDDEIAHCITNNIHNTTILFIMILEQ